MTQGISAVNPPSGFTEIDRGDEWVIYRTTMALGQFGATVNAARVGHDGMVVVCATPDLVAATHDDRDGPLVLELVTDADTEIDLAARTLPAGSRHTQRWLLPTHEIVLPGRITAIGRSGEYVLARVGERGYAVHRVLGTVEDLPASARPGRVAAWTGPPQSRVVATNHLVAVARDDVLLLALPWATPGPRLRVGPGP